MTRSQPPADWIAYAIVLGTVASIFLGKYLVARGDKDQVISKNIKPEDTDNTVIKEGPNAKS